MNPGRRNRLIRAGVLGVDGKIVTEVAKVLQPEVVEVKEKKVVAELVVVKEVVNPQITDAVTQVVVEESVQVKKSKKLVETPE